MRAQLDNRPNIARYFYRLFSPSFLLSQSFDRYDIQLSSDLGNMQNIVNFIYSTKVFIPLPSGGDCLEDAEVPRQMN